MGVLLAAWVLWEAEVDPKTTINKHMYALGGFESKDECVKAAEESAKNLDLVARVMSDSGLAGSVKFSFHFVLGSTFFGTHKDGTNVITRFECWPSDFDPRGK